jgi:hypothetical protein
MKRKKLFLAAVTAVLLTVGFTSCSDSNGGIDDDFSEKLEGIYVLNSGSMGYNNSILTFYNFSTQKTTEKVFQVQNGQSLGDTGQDLLVYGSKIYITVHGSNIIFITDLQGKLLSSIQPEKDGKPQLPRHIIAYGGKVYATLFDGHVAKIDTTLLKIEDQVKVGRNPEKLRVSNNKLYVANSGGLDFNTPLGYDNTVSVINLNSFTETKKIPVVINPSQMEVNSRGDIYLVSNGNYWDVPNALQYINPSTHEVTIVDVHATYMSMGKDDNLYIISSQFDVNWNQTIALRVYDTKAKVLKTDSFISDGTVVEKPYSISTDSKYGYVYIGESDYITNGTMYIFTSTGQFVDKFDTGGLNPMGGYYVNVNIQ